MRLPKPEPGDVALAAILLVLFLLYVLPTLFMLLIGGC